MKPGTNPDDIHTILSRFQTWAGRQNANSPGDLGEGVREIPYDEVMGRLRDRRAPQPDAAAKREAAARTAPAALNPSEARPAAPVKLSVPSAATPASVPADPQTSRTPAHARSSAAAPAKTPFARRKVAPAKTALKSTPAPAAPLIPRSASAAAGKAVSSRAAKSATRAAPQAPRAAGKAIPQKSAPRKAQPADFRQVLAKTIHHEPSPAPAHSKKPDRNQRVSVRLSPAEEQKLQQCAARAGLTVSEYLRRRALEVEPAKPEARTSPLHPREPKSTHAQAAVAASAPSKSTFGDWIALLRNRFLASPVRFAERA